MHKTNIFLVIEALSMLVSPQIKTVKPPDNLKPGPTSDVYLVNRRPCTVANHHLLYHLYQTQDTGTPR